MTFLEGRRVKVEYEVRERFSSEVRYYEAFFHRIVNVAGKKEITDNGQGGVAIAVPQNDRALVEIKKHENMDLVGRLRTVNFNSITLLNDEEKVEI